MSSLQRFLDAQDPVLGEVTRELSEGQKRSHWIWFIFPQVRGLGHSFMAEQYAIASLDEAKQYDAHPLLGVRLRKCVSLVLAVEHKSAERIFGSLDAMKFRSSMTLFNYAKPEEPLYRDALERFFEGVPDPKTIRLLEPS